MSYCFKIKCVIFIEKL